LKYELTYTRRAEKDIKKLDAAVRKRVGKALLQYKSDPMKYAEKLTDPSLGTYRFRIGDYRVAFDIAGSELVVLRVGHRREIYRRRTS
jgi:mRNA interferase RelE/StbE